MNPRHPKLKAPKLRFKVGQRLTYQGVDYVVEAAYRLADDANEWIYILLDMTPIVQLDALAHLDDLAFSEAPRTDRVVFAPFRGSREVMDYFFRAIPARSGRRSDTVHVRNKNLLQAEVHQGV